MAHWRFDEGAGTTAGDAVGGLEGRVAGAAWIDSGFDGSALRFDGVDDSVSIPDDPVLRSDPLSISLWLRGDPSQPPSDGAVILEKGDRDCLGGAFAFVADGNYVALRIRDVGSGEVLSVAVSSDAIPPLWDGAWHHVGFSFAGGEWGGIWLYVDGWQAGAARMTGMDHSALDVAELAVGAPAARDCGRTAFRGAVDDIRIYDRPRMRDDFGAMEPPVATTTTLGTLPALQVGETGSVPFSVSPTPLIAGRLEVAFVDANGVEHVMQGREVYPFPEPGGTFELPVRPEYGGSGTLVARYLPGPPRLPSSASAPLTIEKAPSWASISSRTTVAHEPLPVGVIVDSTAPVPATGTVDLYERTSSGLVHLASGVLRYYGGSSRSGIDFTLPGRPAGTYELEARYSGDLSSKPAIRIDSVTVHPALVPGEVVINDGAEVTSDPEVTVSMPAEGAIAVLVTNDLARWPPSEPYVPSKRTWLTAPWYGDDADGTRTIYVRWADVLGRWSDWKSDTILLDRNLPRGTVRIAGGAAFTRSSSVAVSVAVPDPSAVTEVELSDDGRAWTRFPYAPSVSWNLPRGDGPKTVYARWRDPRGRTSIAESDTIVLDTVAPTMRPPAVSLPTNGTLGTWAVPARLSWAGSDATSGIARYQLLQSLNGGAWTNLSLRSATVTSLDHWLGPGYSYRFAVRAQDRAGNWSGWAYGPTFKVAVHQETSGAIAYSTGWTRGYVAGAYGSYVKYAGVAGPRARLSFSGRNVALVSDRAPNRGRAALYLDGTYFGTLDFYAPTVQLRRIVYSRTFPSSGPHTLEVRPTGTRHAYSKGTRVDLDAVVVLQ